MSLYCKACESPNIYGRVNEATERVMGVRNADLGLQLGYKYTPEECLKLGMVDKICEPNDLMHVAKSEMSKWLAVPGNK